MTRTRAAADQIEFFAAEPTLPSGVVYRDDVMTAAEERSLAAQLADLPVQAVRISRLSRQSPDRLLRLALRLRGARFARGCADPAFPAPVARARRGVRRSSTRYPRANSRHRICGGRRHRLASRQARIRSRPLAARALHAVLPSQAGSGAGSVQRSMSGRARPICCAGPRGMNGGAQHPAARPAALFRNIPPGGGRAGNSTADGALRRRSGGYGAGRELRTAAEASETPPCTQPGQRCPIRRSSRWRASSFQPF